MCAAGDSIPTRSGRPSPPSQSSDRLGRFCFGFLKSRTHYPLKSPNSSCQREPVFHCCPTTDIMSSHPGKQKAFLHAGGPTRVLRLPLGSWGQRGGFTRAGQEPSHYPWHFRLHMELCGSSGQRRVFLSAQHSADKCIIN